MVLSEWRARITFKCVNEREIVSRLEFVGEAEKIAREAGALLRGFYEKGVATEY